MTLIHVLDQAVPFCKRLLLCQTFVHYDLQLFRTVSNDSTQQSLLAQENTYKNG